MVSENCNYDVSVRAIMFNMHHNFHIIKFITLINLQVDLEKYMLCVIITLVEVFACERTHFKGFGKLEKFEFFI